MLEAQEGKNVIVHVGFALNGIDEAEAKETLDMLRRIGDLSEFAEFDAERKSDPGGPDVEESPL